MQWKMGSGRWAIKPALPEGVSCLHRFLEKVNRRCASEAVFADSSSHSGIESSVLILNQYLSVMFCLSFDLSFMSSGCLPNGYRRHWWFRLWIPHMDPPAKSLNQKSATNGYLDRFIEELPSSSWTSQTDT